MSLLNRNFAPDEASGLVAAAATATATVVAATVVEPPWEGPAKAVPTETAKPAQQAALAVVHAPSAALALARNLDSTAILKSLKDAIRVNWDTLTRMKANQGQFMVDGLKVGGVLDIQVMSYQTSWQASPGGLNTPATTKLVRYSDGGETIANTGEDIKEYVRGLIQAGHPKARLNRRIVLVFQVVGSPDPKAAGIIGELFQLSLAPTSVSKFEALCIKQAMWLGQGRITEAESTLLRLTVDSASKDGTDYAVVIPTFTPR